VRNRPIQTVDFNQIVKALKGTGGKMEDNKEPIAECTTHAKCKGEVWVPGEIWVKHPIPPGEDPIQYAMKKERELVEAWKALPQDNGINGSTTAQAQIPIQNNNQPPSNTRNMAGVITNGRCNLCSGLAVTSKTGNQYCKCWYK